MSIFSNKQVIELPLARNYVAHWGFQQAVREIIQNALDSESPFEYELSEDTLKIHSRHSILQTKSLLLGNTSKAEKADKIGSFGEGYKIALLVLLRNNYGVQILNGKHVWTPIFRYSNLFEADVLCIEQSIAPTANEGITFIVKGLTPNDIQAVKDSCLYLQDNIGATQQTQYGRILKDRPGKLYVGSLYVCDTELAFGYDVNPKYLRLERDRQTVSSFDLQWLTKDIWLATENYDTIVRLVEENKPDMKYINHGAPEILRETCYRIFKERNPGAVVVDNQKDLEAKVAQGLIKVVVAPTPHKELLESSPSYRRDFAHTHKHHC